MIKITAPRGLLKQRLAAAKVIRGSREVALPAQYFRARFAVVWLDERADRGFRFRTYISKGELVLISSKGRYALRLAVCVAQAGPDAKVSLREVAEHEELSLKYLEQIARPMVSAGLLTSVRGKGGGYRLSRDPHEILAGDVLRAVEGTTVPVTCASLEGPEPCHRASVCTTVRFWAGLDEVIENYVDGVTVGDLADAPQPHIQLADAAPAES